MIEKGQSNQVTSPNQPIVRSRLSSSGPCSPIDIPKAKSSNNLSSTASIPRPKSYDGRPIRSPVNNSPQMEDPVPLRKVVSTSNSVGTESSEGTSAINKYMPSAYLGLLGDGQSVSPTYISSERDFAKHIGTIQTSLLNKDDWQARQNGLLKLQSLLKGIAEVSELNEDQLNPEMATELLVGHIRSSLHETVLSIGIFLI